ncbi:transforming acidic coiled-coil protein isoform 2-T2 [Glossina fuscipes fuscipes]
MDFLPNFIKRPLSLVLNEATETTAKVSTAPPPPPPPSSSSSNSVSLSLSKMKGDRVAERAPCESPPNSRKESSPLSENRTLSNNTTPTSTTPVRRSSLSSSYHGQISEFLAITNKLLDYDDFRQLNSLNMNFDIPHTNSENISSSSPAIEKATVTECKTSQTIEQLLIEINDNLNQADLVEDVCNLSLSSSPHAQHSPLSASKTLLVNTRPLTPASSPSVLLTPSTPTMAATCCVSQPQCDTTSLTAAGAVIATEVTSAFNKYRNAPDAMQVTTDNHLHNKQITDIKDLHNDCAAGSNKSLNRFLGLAGFDETKIPNLPTDTDIGDIEGQLKIIYDVREITKDGKLQPNVLLPNETDETISSDNELFTDCHEELSSIERRDCLSSPYIEHSVNKTLELESYYSTVNDTISASDRTLDELPEIPMDEGQKQQCNKLDEVEPMEVDMNATIEMLEATSSTNILYVEKVLEQAERHILQHMEEEESLRTKEKNALAEKAIKRAEKELQLNKHIDLPTKGEKSSTKASGFIGEFSTASSSTGKTELNLNLVGQSSDESIGKHEKSLSDSPTFSKELNITINSYSHAPKSVEENKNHLNNTLVEQDLPSFNNINFDLPIRQSEKRLNFDITSIEEESSVSPLNDLPIPLNCNYVEQDLPSLNNLNFALPLSYREQRRIFDVASTENAVNLVNSTLVEQDLPSFNNLNFILPPEHVEKKRTFNVEATGSLAEIDTKENLVTDKEKRRTYNMQEDRDNINIAMTLSNAGSEKRRTFNIPSIESDAIIDTKENIVTDLEKRRTFNIQEEIGDINTTMTLTKTGFENRRTFNIPSVEDGANMDTQHTISNDSEKRRTFNIHDNRHAMTADVKLDNIDTEKRGTCTGTLAEEVKKVSTQDMIMTTKNEERRTFSIQEETALATIGGITENGDSLFNVPAEGGIQAGGSINAESVQNKIEEHNEMMEESEKSQESEPKDVQRSEKTVVRKEMISNYEAMDVDETTSPVLKSVKNPVKVDIENINWAVQANHFSSTSTKQVSPENQQSTLENENLEAPLKSLTNDKQKTNEIHENIRTDTVTTSIETLASSQISQDKQASSVPTSKGIQKRPSIHDYKNQGDVLSAKEQSSIRVRDEKELMTEKSSSPLEEMFTAPSTTSITLSISDHSGFDTNSPNAHSSNNTSNNAEQPEFDENEFSGNNNSNNNVPVDRSSLLLKFDPLVGIPIPINTGQALAQGLKLQSQQQEQRHHQEQQQQQQQLRLHLLNATNNNANNRPCLSPTLEENSTEDISFVNEPTTKTFTQVTNRLTKGKSIQQPKQQQQQQQQQSYKPDKNQLLGKEYKKHATMSVDVDVIKDVSLDNDCNKTYDNSNNTSPTDDKPQINYKMDELEKKIKNEVLKTEDIEKKLKDAEQREEALIKRITEKDKALSKMNGVIEAYEKAIAELIAEKEQLIQNYEKQLVEVKADRDSYYHHLTSLETTFSDLHVKYEKSKEMTCQLKGNEEALLAEKRRTLENLRLQEQRYEKMKSHAMQQLEIANKKLESLTKDHAIETTKLKALLKKQEIAHSSITEQLMQKTKENAELMKICDELISGQGS